VKDSSARQANFILPGDLIDELRRSVPRGEQSKVVADALRKELKRLRFRQALEHAFGAWRIEEHPELEQGTEQYVSWLRRSSRITRRGDR
jgi:Flp pilus assembly protein CpaB